MSPFADDVPRIAAAIDGLTTSCERMKSTITSLKEAGATTAARCTAVAARLTSTQDECSAAKVEGEALRKTHKLLSELDAVRALLAGGTTTLRRCLPMLEEIRQRMFAGKDGSGPPVSDRAAAALREVVAALADAQESEFRTWTEGGGDTLFHGARALALAPPGGLSHGVDGLERERASMEEAKSLLSDAARIDTLVAATAASAGRMAQRASLVERCHALFRTSVAARLTAELQAAIRLAAHASGAESAALLEAVAEAAATAARAARAVASIFGLLPPPDDGATSGEAGGAAASSSSSEAAAASDLAAATDAVLAKLTQAPNDAGRPAALKALGAEARDLLRRELEVVPRLVAVAHSTRGRRALGVLGEAGERLAAAALAQAGNELQ